MPIEIVLSFSSRDQEAAHALERHLTPLIRAGRITLWHRDKVLGGEDADEAWRARAQQAPIILLMVSADLENDRDRDITEALAQRQQRGARVIPVLWRTVDLQDLRFKELRMIPDGRAIEARKDHDAAWVEVVQGIRRVVEAIAAQPEVRPAPPAVAPAATTPPVQTPPVTPARPIDAPRSSRIKILFLGANPSDTVRLRLPEERREIDRRIQMGAERDRFDLQDAWAVNAGELSQTLLRYLPGILHFSGHGSAQGELLFNNESGKAQPVPAAALARLFRLFAAQGLRCVVLNACYSETQAAAIAEHVDCVVGVDGELADEAANAFSAGFYTGLAAGQSVELAFEFGCVQLDMLNLPGADRLKLRGKPGVNLGTLHLTK